MAINKKASRMSLGSDPAVEASMGGGVNHDPLYGRIKTQRSRMTNQQIKQARRDAARTKVTYDLPEEIASKISLLADDGRYPPSHLAAILLAYGIQALEEKQINLYGHRVPSNIPRFDWYLRLTVEEADKERLERSRRE